MTPLDRVADMIEPVAFLPSPFAPGWSIAASRLPDGATVSGRGPDREAARLSCLGEAAESLSAARRPDDSVFRGRDALTGAAVDVDAAAVTMTDLTDPNDPGSDGLAAGASLADATRRAVLERIERHHAALWWKDDGEIGSVSKEWLDHSGLAALLTRARAGALAPRETRFITIGAAGPARTMVAVSTEPDGSGPVTGIASGLGWAEAGRSALSELFQMELAWFIASQMALRGHPGGHAGALERAARLHARTADLLHGPLIDPASDPGEEPAGSLEDAIAALNHKIVLVDLTRLDIGVPVVRAHAPGLASVRALRTDPHGAPM